MGAFSRQAKKEGCAKEETDGVLNEARRRDYDHLLAIEECRGFKRRRLAVTASTTILCISCHRFA